MKVTLFTEPSEAESRRVWEMLEQLAPRHNFELHEAASPAGAPSPCVKFDAPGAPFHNAQSLTEEQFLTYLQSARQPLLAGENSPGEKGPRPAKKAGSAPTAEFEAGHPVRSFMWRHRVGAIIGSLSVFVGLAWVAPLTPSWGWGDGFYDAVNRTYRLVCDQVVERSAEVGGLPVCLCWRCTAIYLGALFFGILYTVGRDRKLDFMQWLVRPVGLGVMLLYGLPMIIDGASHALGARSGIEYANSPDFWLSWNEFSADWWLRISTALIATAGAVKFLCPRLDKLGSVYESLYKARKRGNGTVLDNAPAGLSIPQSLN